MGSLGRALWYKLMMINGTFVFFTFILLPMIFSIPAFYKLKKRGQLTFIDPFTYFFAAIYILQMGCYFEKYQYAVASLGNLFFEPLAALVLAIIINYLKLLTPKSMSRWFLSLSSILVLFILTTIMWYFFPGMGD